MNPKETIALAPAAAALAAAAPAIAVGAAIGLGLIWLFSDDKKPATANAKAGNEPPQPDAQRSGGIVEDLEREWGMRDDPKPETRKQGTGWFFFDDEEPAAPTPAPMDEAQRQQRIRDNEAEIARERRELAKLKREQRRREDAAQAAANAAKVEEAARTVTQPASPIPAPAASPQTTILDAPVTAPATPANVTGQAAPGRFQLKPRKYDPAHLEAVLKAGPLPRNAVVKALKAAPFNYGHTLAYTTLQRFSDFLEETPAGLLAWKGAN